LDAWIGIEMTFNLTPLVNQINFEINGSILKFIDKVEGNTLVIGLNDESFLGTHEGTLRLLDTG